MYYAVKFLIHTIGHKWLYEHDSAYECHSARGEMDESAVIESINEQKITGLREM